MFAQIEIEDKKVKEIMDRLDKAQQEIMSCYSELTKLNVVVVKKAPTTEEEN